MKALQFTQTNLPGVIERANELLENLKELQLGSETADRLAKEMLNKPELQQTDVWEVAAWALVRIELLERAVREDDQNTESYPKDWNGGMPKDKEVSVALTM